MGNTLREYLSSSLIIYQCLPNKFVVWLVPDLRLMYHEDSGLLAKPRTKSRTMRAHNKTFQKIINIFI